MLGDVFERFVEKSPISVMVRAALERVLGADRLDLWYERTAQKPSTRDLLFSSVSDLMHQLVFCVQPSARARSPRSSSTWAVHAPLGLKAIGSKSSRATASQPVSIACKHCVKPRGVP